jgi:hypothetical protein
MKRWLSLGMPIQLLGTGLFEDKIMTLCPSSDLPVSHNVSDHVTFTIQAGK